MGVSQLVPEQVGSLAASLMKAEDLARRRRIAYRVCIGEMLCLIGNTPLISTRAPLVLAYYAGNSSLAARALGAMTSGSAVVELLIAPILGRLSDTVGRKRSFFLFPIVASATHILVGTFPKVLAFNFADRVLSGGLLFTHITMSNAALADLFEGDDLAQMRVVKQSMFSAALVLGPLLGNLVMLWRDAATAFLLCPIASAVSMIVLAQIPETLAPEHRRPMDWAACNPLRFLKLFRSKASAVLTIARGLQDSPEFISIYDIK